MSENKRRGLSVVFLITLGCLYFIFNVTQGQGLGIATNEILGSSNQHQAIKSGFFQFITNPTLVYLLFLIGIYGVLFESFHTGLFLPGIVGICCLILAIYSFQFLPINYVGLSLLVLGIFFIIGEVMVSTYGILAIVGISLFIIGSLYFLNSNSPGMRIALEIILLMSFITLGFFSLIVYLAIKATRRPIVTGKEALINKEGLVLDTDNTNFGSMVQIDGEIWQAISSQPLKSRERVRVISVSDLMLVVEPVKK